MDKAIHILALAAILLAATLCPDLTNADSLLRPSRFKRQTSPEKEEIGGGLDDLNGLEAESGSGEPEVEAKGSDVSLGKILGLVFLACCIIYCIGISWKVYKVCKGTYVEEEPVFLKYK